MANLDTRGRVTDTPSWPQGGTVSRPMGDRNYEVQQITGFSTGTVPGSNWVRGQYAHFDAPTFRPNPQGLFMYDPTDPNTYFVKGRG